MWAGFVNDEFKVTAGNGGGNYKFLMTVKSQLEVPS